MHRIYVYLSRQKSARRKTGEKRPLEGCEPLCVYVCACFCVCVRVSMCVCAYMYVCVSASRVLKILLLLLSSSLLGLGGYGRCRKDIFRYCARPEQPSVTSSPRRAPLKEKKNRYYIHIGSRGLGAYDTIFPTSPQRHHLVGVARRPSLFLICGYLFVLF